MYYKVMKNDKVIDVLDTIVYLKYQPKHKTMILSDENEAQAILLSDKNTICHEETLYNIPVSGYETVRLEQINKFEYEELRRKHLLSYEEIVDNTIFSLIEGGIL